MIFDKLIGSYAGSLIMDTISSVKNTPINSKSEDTFFIEGGRLGAPYGFANS
jgi:hypothetical protein